MLTFKKTHTIVVLDRRNDEYYTFVSKAALAEWLGDRTSFAVMSWFKKSKTKRYKDYEIINIDGHFYKKGTQSGRSIS
jgi:hypothetical protein